jgi:hypothetical protein
VVKSVFVILLLWVFVVLLPLSSGISAEIYKWEDKNGKIHFSDSPPPAGVGAEIKQFKEEPAPKENIKPKASPNLPPPTSELGKEKRAYSNINVIMYMTTW